MLILRNVLAISSLVFFLLAPTFFNPISAQTATPTPTSSTNQLRITDLQNQINDLENKITLVIHQLHGFQ